jgi:tRNA (cytidine/uridine-2'-O-)-methyltransferase
MLNIVLFEPEIPQNTGYILRTCVATNATLHLIKPLGFYINDKYLRRSGVDYIDKLTYFIYDNYNDFINKNKGKFYFYSRYGKKVYSETNFDVNDNIYLIFGRESTGIDKTILANNLDSVYRIPTSSDVRSINLSNCVALVVYESLRQMNFPNLEKMEPEIHKGANFLDQFVKK